MKTILFVFLISIFFVSCEKIPYDQYYVWENNTDTTFLLVVNPPESIDQNYYIFKPSTYIDKIWPQIKIDTLEPYETYILHGTMICDYYDEWFIVWVYPPNDGDTSFITGKNKYLNIIEKDGVSHDRYN